MRGDAVHCDHGSFEWLPGAAPRFDWERAHGDGILHRCRLGPPRQPALASPAKRKPIVELPAFISRRLATLVDRAPAGSEWAHEIKFDDYRMAARLEDRGVRMLTRNALDWTAKFRPIAAVAAKTKARTAYLDGKIVVLDDAGISDFGALQEALSEGRTERMVYFAFDLLHLDGRDLTLSQPAWFSSDVRSAERAHRHD
jgi:ATP-dependent DNA ligase